MLILFLIASDNISKLNNLTLNQTHTQNEKKPEVFFQIQADRVILKYYDRMINTENIVASGTIA